MDCLLSRVSAIARAAPDSTALVQESRRIDYRGFIAQVEAFAASLVQRGMQPGDRVAIVLPNRIEAAVASYAIWCAGGIAVPLNVQARQRDLQPWLRHCGARLVLHEAGHADIVLALAALAPDVAGLALGPAQSLSEAFPPTDGVNLAAGGDPNAVALLLYTSGTTGAPKGVMLSHANLLANVSDVVDYLGLRPDDSILSALPFYYAYGASVLHTHLTCGATVMLAPNLMFPHLLVQAMAEQRITGFSGVPSTYALLLDKVDFGQYELGALRYLTQAGGAMSPALTRRLRESLPQARLFVMYGQTEATSRLTWLPPEQLERKLGSVGIPLRSVRLQVRRDDGTMAAPGESGAVWVRGPNVMLGYWDNAEASAAVLQDGWLHTGDIGHLDADGYLFLAGRRSDMIKTGAHRVHPGDIEDAIAEFDGVREVAVVGIDDEVLGQVIKAFVVADELGPRAEDRIKAHCRACLAPYKIPKHVEFVSALPRTASGKVRRFQLTSPQATP